HQFLFHLSADRVTCSDESRLRFCCSMMKRYLAVGNHSLASTSADNTSTFIRVTGWELRMNTCTNPFHSSLAATAMECLSTRAHRSRLISANTTTPTMSSIQATKTSICSSSWVNQRTSFPSTQH